MVDTFTGTTPAYTELLMKELENARDLARAQYQPYIPQEGLERVTPFTPLQQQTFGLAEEMGREQQPGGYYPEIYGEARGAIRNALGQNVAPFINRATGPTDIAEFYNPFQEQVIQNLEREGARNLQENILPNVNTRFIGAGQYGSTGHQDLTNRAIRDTIEAASKARAGAQAEGFNTALNAALGKQQTQLQGGQLAGKDIERQMLGGEALQNLAGARQTGAIRNIGVLGQLGGQQQQQGQNISNIAYENYQRQANFPYQKQSFLSEQLRGLQPQTQVYPGSPPVTPPMQPQASPWTQAGGLLAGATGSFNQRPQGYAHGGVVKKLSHHRHYADGGSLSPIQKGANHAIDTAELQSVREQANKFAQPNVDPFWASIARAGFDVAANRQPGVLAKLGEAGGKGLTEYHSQLANQENRELQSANIMKLIDDTKRLQAENNRKHELEKEKLGEKKRQFGMTHGIEAGRLGLEKQKFEHEKSLYEKGLKGTKASTKTSQQLNAERKANQEQLKEWGNRVSRGPEVVKLLTDIRKLNEEIKTPGYESFLDDYKLSKPIANFLKSARSGKATVDQMDALTSKLEAAKIGLLTGKQSTVAHQQTIKQTKPRKERSYEANEQIIGDDLYKEKREMDEAKFGIKMFNKYKDPISGVPTINSAEIKNAYKEYEEDKRNWEETHDKSIPFEKTPEDYLEDTNKEEDIQSPQIKINSDISDESVLSGIYDLIG